MCEVFPLLLMKCGDCTFLDTCFTLRRSLKRATRSRLSSNEVKHEVFPGNIDSSHATKEVMVPLSTHLLRYNTFPQQAKTIITSYGTARLLRIVPKSRGHLENKSHQQHRVLGNYLIVARGKENSFMVTIVILTL